MVAKLRANHVIVDARLPKEYNEGHIDGAINLIGNGEIFEVKKTVGLPGDKNTPLVVFGGMKDGCQSGLNTGGACTRMLVESSLVLIMLRCPKRVSASGDTGEGRGQIGRAAECWGTRLTYRGRRALLHARSGLL